MSLDINITIGPPSLPTLSKEQREADRAKKLDFDEQKKVDENARVASNKQLKKLGFGLASGGSLTPGVSLEELLRRGKHHKPQVNFLKVDPAASRRGGSLTLGRTWIRQPQNIEGFSSFTVWSGDGLVSASVPVPLVDSQQFRTWEINGGAPPNVSSEYGETGWFRFAPNTVYNTTNLAVGVDEWYSETGGDFRYRNLPGEPRPFDVVIQRWPIFLLDGTTYNRRFNVLPIGGEACIVLATWDAVTTGILATINDAAPGVAKYISQGGGVSSGTAAFYVDRTSARVIPVPTSIAGRPQPTIGAASNGQINLPVSYEPWWNSQGPIEVGNAWKFVGNSDDDYGPYVQQFSFYTPVEFLWIRNADGGWAPGAADAVVEQYGVSDVPVSSVRALLPPGVNDFKETLFFESQFFESNFWTYSLQERALQRNDLQDVVEDVPYDLDDPGWSEARLATVQPDVTFEALLATPVRFWDWEKPTYCRERLLSLGFTEADITPLQVP